jgi:hypothetical protein
VHTVGKYFEGVSQSCVVEPSHIVLRQTLTFLAYGSCCRYQPHDLAVAEAEKRDK